MGTFEQLLALVPDAPSWNIDWHGIESCALKDYADEMRRTPQSPQWHAEGDVWTHTRMVCEALVAMPEFRELTPAQRRVLFLAALLHDVGKTVTTRQEGSEWTSPGHASKGALMTRDVLWKEFGMCGSEEAKEYLRRRQPFVWNATCITVDIRRQLIDLFESYEPPDPEWGTAALFR